MKGEFSSMNEETKSTNVDSSDKLTEDLKKGIPEICVCEPLVKTSKLNENEFTIVINPVQIKEENEPKNVNGVTIDTDIIIIIGEADLVAKPLTEEKRKELKQKQAEQEKEMEKTKQEEIIEQ